MLCRGPDRCFCWALWGGGVKGTAVCPHQVMNSWKLRIKLTGLAADGVAEFGALHTANFLTAEGLPYVTAWYIKHRPSQNFIESNDTVYPARWRNGSASDSS